VLFRHFLLKNLPPLRLPEFVFGIAIAIRVQAPSSSCLQVYEP